MQMQDAVYLFPFLCANRDSPNKLRTVEIIIRLLYDYYTICKSAPHPAFTCSKLIIETTEQVVKYVQR